MSICLHIINLEWYPKLLSWLVLTLIMEVIHELSFSSITNYDVIGVKSEQ